MFVDVKDLPEFAKTILEENRIRPRSVEVISGNTNPLDLISYMRSRIEDSKNYIEYMKKRTIEALAALNERRKMYEERGEKVAWVCIGGSPDDRVIRRVHIYRPQWAKSVTSITASTNENALSSSYSEQEAYLGFNYLLESGDMIFITNKGNSYSSAKLYVHPDDILKLIPQNIPTTLNEDIVLYAARSLKNTYAGSNNVRFEESNRETGITQAEYTAAKESCIAKGLMSRNGAITTAGKNVLGKVFSFDAVVRKHSEFIIDPQ